MRRNRADHLKTYLLEQLAAAGRASVQGKLFTVAVAASPASVKVTDAAQVLATYLIPQPPKVDTRAILAAWKETGEVPAGVEIECGQHLRIR